MERIMPLVYSPMQKRAAVSDAMLPARNVGIVMAGTLLNDRITLAGGAFNNWLDKDQSNSFSDNSTQYVGRVTWLPFLSSNESSLLHLGFGIRYSDAEERFAAGAEPEFKQAPKFVKTTTLEADHFTTYQAEISMRSGPFWLHGEYIRSDSDAPILGNPSLGGYHLTASWILSGEVRPYNKRVGIFGGAPISRGVNQNGWGTWELSTRYSSVDLTDGQVEGGEMDIWSAGVNWWLTPYMNFNVNYR